VAAQAVCQRELPAHFCERGLRAVFCTTADAEYGLTNDHRRRSFVFSHGQTFPPMRGLGN
jgi:hypothetical protein